MADGKNPAQCWCMSTPVSQAALQRLPQAQRGQACICPQCARPLPVPEQAHQSI
ncbi:cysteine-rich CWC family protein [Oryzisolibacter sp. LB2S]|uniref:cysteine-rich CWC family protein n=1 Tax=Alicycliphilus soli TaxID=3228789 RepID=UPI0034579643